MWDATRPITLFRPTAPLFPLKPSQFPLPLLFHALCCFPLLAQQVIVASNTEINCCYKHHPPTYAVFSHCESHCAYGKENKSDKYSHTYTNPF